MNIQNDTPATAPRRRMTEDMQGRNLGPHSQRNHLDSCARIAAFPGRAPDRSTADDIRRFQLFLIETGASTLPGPIADIAYQNKRALYDLLMRASAETTLTIAADRRHLGARIGLTSGLHTWGSARDPLLPVRRQPAAAGISCAPSSRPKHHPSAEAADPTLATPGCAIGTGARQHRLRRSPPLCTPTRPSRRRRFPIGPPEPSAHCSRDFVPWRFSDAGKRRAQLNGHDAASEKPTHGWTYRGVAPRITAAINLPRQHPSSVPAPCGGDRRGRRSAGTR